MFALVRHGVGRLVVKASVTPGAVRPGNAYFEQLDIPLVAIKKLPATTAFRDSYPAKLVFREISLLKQARRRPQSESAGAGPRRRAPMADPDRRPPDS